MIICCDTFAIGLSKLSNDVTSHSKLPLSMGILSAYSEFDNDWLYTILKILHWTICEERETKRHQQQQEKKKVGFIFIIFCYVFYVTLCWEGFSLISGYIY